MTAPSYRALLDDGRLAQRAAQALAGLTACRLCARRCGADRTQGIRRATCQIGRLAKVASWGAWTDAPACLAGAGAILFSGCNLRCLACSTASASWEGDGGEVSARHLADIMLALQARGHGHLALISPSHVPAQILEALVLAAADGFCLPLVWDTGGYDSVETLKLFDGVVDIYLPDLKHGDAGVARMCTGVADYPTVNAQAIAEMHRQVGPLWIEGGKARRGVLVRHLVLPNEQGGSATAFAGLPAGTQVEVLGSYQPVFRANRMAKLNRPVNAEEMAAATEALALSPACTYQ